MHTSEVFVGGQWRPPASGETYATINPATEEVSAQVAKGDERDIDLAVQAARRAFDQGPWPRMAAAERARVLWKLADLITANVDEMARLESVNTGKTLFDSGKVELPFAAEVFRYYAGWTTKIHGETLNLRDGAFTFTLRQPLGVVGAIVPWNFPFLLASWKIAPALAAGNTLVLKPASLTPLTALRFAELTQEAGLPEGVFNLVPGPGGKAGMALVRHPGVDKIAFTGSTDVGKGIMREAAGSLKRVSLELGGKSPNVVFADADMEAALRGAMTGIFYNKGEVCAAGSRLLVEQRVHDEFVGKLVERVKGLKVGDPMDKGTRMGPVVSAQQLETVLGYVEAGRREGATLAAGGERVRVGDGRGYFVQPTVFTGVQQHHADRARGDLRTGPVRHPVQGRRRRRGPGERDVLRPGGRRLDPGRRQGAEGRPCAPRRNRLGQRVQSLRRRPALRRLQGVGFRARARPGRAGPLHGGQERLGRPRLARLGDEGQS